VVDTRDEETSLAVQRVLDRWYVTRLAPGDHRAADASLRFTVGGAPRCPPEREAFVLSDAAISRAGDTTYRIVLDGSVVDVDGSAVVKIWLDRPLNADSDLPTRVVCYALLPALRRCGVFELHGGAVVDGVTGRAILICGPSGSGKSTLTLQLAADGWSYVSDDAVLLNAGSTRVEAFGLRRLFGVTRRTLEAMGLPYRGVPIDDGASGDSVKCRLEPQALFPSGFARTCGPDLLVFPVVTGEPTSRLRRLSPAQAMAHLIRLCPWSCYDRATAREFLDVLARLVRQTASFDLLAGRDLLGDPDYTSNLLRSAVAVHD